MPNSTLRELELARDKQIEVSNQLSEQVNELREGKGVGDVKLTETQTAFLVSERQVEALNRQINAMRPATEGLTRTGVKNAWEASPTARFMNAAARKGDGNQGLEAHELEDQRALAEKGGFENIRRPNDYIMPIRNAYTTTTGAELIQTDVMSGIVEKLLDFGGARRVAGRISTSGGNPIKVPNADESTQMGAMIAENAEAPVHTAPTPGETTFSAYTYTSKALNITKQSISDTGANGFDLIGYQLRQAARRLARKMDADYTVADGSSKPQGVVAAAAQHAQIVGTGAISGLAYSDLVKLVGSIDSAYLSGGEYDADGSTAESGMIAWLFHQAFETQLMLLTDGDGRSLWSPGLTAAANSPRMNTLLGYPYVVSNSMDGTINTGANKVACVFGNIGGYFKIREVDSILIRLFDDSGTASTNSVQILGYARGDSRTISAGTTSDAFKKLTTKA